MENILQIALTALLWVLLSVAVIWLPAWWLWNNLISELFDLPALSFFQSTGLVIYVWLAAKGAAKFKFELGGES